MEASNKWGSGEKVLTYRKENRRQPQGFWPEQPIATEACQNESIQNGKL